MFKLTFEELTNTTQEIITTFCKSEQEIVSRLIEEYESHYDLMQKEEGYKPVFYGDYRWCRFNMPYGKKNGFKLKSVEWRYDETSPYITMFRENVWCDGLMKKILQRVERIIEV